MRMLSLLVSLNLLGVAPVGAEPRAMADVALAGKSPQQARIRVDVLSRATKKVGPNEALEPNRVYSVYRKELDRRVLVQANPSGGLDVPLEALAPGSVLDASAVGGETGKRYLLRKDATWTAVGWPLEKRVWTLSAQPKFRVYLPQARAGAAPTERTPAATPKGLFRRQ